MQQMPGQQPQHVHARPVLRTAHAEVILIFIAIVVIINQVVVAPDAPKTATPVHTAQPVAVVQHLYHIVIFPPMVRIPTLTAILHIQAIVFINKF